MVDTRVVRRSMLNPSMAKSNDKLMDQEEPVDTEQNPGCILFDSRLIKGDVFANPIVTVTGNQHENRRQSNRRSSGSRLVTTPPPVKGRKHVGVQTEGTGRIDVGVSQLFMSVRSCAQHDSQSSLQDQVDEFWREALPEVGPTANSDVVGGIQKENVAPAGGN
eukprot:392750_1